MSKNNAITKVASGLARCEVIRELETLCESQKSVSTRKLSSILDNISNRLKSDASKLARCVERENQNERV